MDINNAAYREKLYDPYRKIWFMEEYASTKNSMDVLYSFFNIIGRYEKEIDKDLSLMTTEELKTAFSRLGATKITTRMNHLNFVRAYRRWCEQNRFPITDVDLKRLSIIETDIIRKRYVKSPGALQQYLDIVVPDLESKQSDRLFRGVMWLAYSGILMEKADKVRCSDVDIDNRRIRFEGENYPLYEESIPVMRFLATSDTILYDHGNYKIERKRVEGDTLLRGIRGTPDAKWFMSEFNRRAAKKVKDGETNIRLNYYTVLNSGRFYREWHLESSLNRTNFRRYAEIDMSSDPERVNKGEALYKRSVINKTEGLSREYVSWRLAFDI